MEKLRITVNQVFKGGYFADAIIPQELANLLPCFGFANTSPRLRSGRGLSYEGCSIGEALDRMYLDILDMLEAELSLANGRLENMAWNDPYIFREACESHIKKLNDAIKFLGRAPWVS